MPQYTIVDKDPLPSGGKEYSDSYRALAQATDSPSEMIPVVLKFPRLLLAPDKLHAYTESIKKGTCSQSTLRHPNVNPIVQLLQLPDHPLAVVQKIQQGGDILTYIKQSKSSCDVWPLIKETARGLRYLHDNKIVHGNVHPTNILIDDDGHACLTDIGIHTLLFYLHREGGIPKTFTHKPAEEISGEENAPGLLTKAMDVYAYGSSVFHILTGRAPYETSHWSYVRKLQHIVDHGHISLPRPPQITTEVWRIIQGCWARDPQDRMTMAQVVLALEQYHLN